MDVTTTCGKWSVGRAVADKAGGRVLFLVDSAADPVPVEGGGFISPPLRFFAIGNSPALVEYVGELNQKAVADFERDKQAAAARAEH